VNAYDIETFVDPKTFYHVPYCVVFFLNKNAFFIYFKENIDILLLSLEIIFSQVKNNTLTIFYVHKLSFDGSLLISTLTKKKTYNFLVFTREIDLFSIKIFSDKKIIEFRCSKKILPLSLKEIASLFKLPPKLPFPYKFASQEVLEYKGATPHSNFFNCVED
jgi:hypothetical protein